jgi:comEA protein
MVRTLLSFVALVTILAAPTSPAAAGTPQPQAAGAAAQARRKPAARAGAKPPVTGTININTAAANELENLPGIGARTAARIVEYRQKNGPFKKIEELMNVRGIGEKNFLKLKPQITVGQAKTDHEQALR